MDVTSESIWDCMMGSSLEQRKRIVDTRMSDQEGGVEMLKHVVVMIVAELLAGQVVWRQHMLQTMT